MTARPRVLIFTGDGKGKTTAALGLALRAAGQGMRTCVVQFVKSDRNVGEVRAAENGLGIEVHTMGLGFLPKESNHPQAANHREAAAAALAKAAEVIAGGEHEVVILDEVCVAVSRGLVAEADVAALIAAAPATKCLVLTGRDASPGLLELADTVTEMRCLKHALRQGRVAEEGVEF